MSLYIVLDHTMTHRIVFAITSYFIMICHTILSYLWHLITRHDTMSCHIALYDTASHHITIHHAITSYVILYQIQSHYITACHATSHYAIHDIAIISCAASCNITLDRITSCFNLFPHTLPYYIVLCQISFILQRL